MNDFYAEGNYFTINHVVLLTGLSDRTIRNYISAGFLEGEKINGIWSFTSEQIQKFLVHPSVRPSIIAKNNSIVYDFLLEDKKTSAESCIILDLPDGNPKNISRFFCDAISNGGYKNVRFAFDQVSGVARVILKGYTADVLELVNRYYQEHR